MIVISSEVLHEQTIYGGYKTMGQGVNSSGLYYVGLYPDSWRAAGFSLNASLALHQTKGECQRKQQKRQSLLR